MHGLKTGREAFGDTADTQTEAAHFCNTDAPGDYSVPVVKNITVQRTTIDETSTDVTKDPGPIKSSVCLRGLHQTSVDKHRVNRCADAAMCGQIEPTPDKIRGIVGELHGRAEIRPGPAGRAHQEH
nr:unnamed protein product [Leishmania braziliensis]